MKRLKRVVFFTDADKLDRLPGDLPNGKRRAAAGVAVHFGQHHAGKRQLLMELLGGTDGILSGHGVGHEQDFLGIEQPLERLHFVHEFIVNMQAAGGIHDHHVTARVHGLAFWRLWPAARRSPFGLANFTLVQMGFDSCATTFNCSRAAGR